MDGDKVKWVDWFAIIWWIALISLFILLANLSCTPLQITNVKIVDEGCDCVCLSWETNQEAVCKVTYCDDKGGLCYTSPMEPGYSTLHSIGIPPGSKDVTITAISQGGQSTSIKVGP
jgi:hypothetical protein